MGSEDIRTKLKQYGKMYGGDMGQVLLTASLLLRVQDESIQGLLSDMQLIKTNTNETDTFKLATKSIQKWS